MFSRNIEMRHVWQPRFWEHTIRNEQDYRRHMDYVYINPLKHGYVGKVVDWPYSTFHRDVREGLYPADWAGEIEDFAAGSGSKKPGGASLTGPTGTAFVGRVRRSRHPANIMTQSSKPVPAVNQRGQHGEEGGIVQRVAKGIRRQHHMAGNRFQCRTVWRVRALAVDEYLFANAQYT